MQKACIQCRSAFEITDEDLQFYDQVSPVFAGKKYSISPPTHCPDCRQQRRLAHCNERSLTSGECGLCHKRTLTQFHPESGSPYYCRECWHSDAWDPLSWGRDFDSGKPFFEQIGALKRSVPSLALDVQGELINCDYIHYAGSSKNCYLIMHADFCEDCYYGYGFKKNRSCVDGFYNLHSELCYDCVDIHNCYGLRGSQDCINCHSGAFLRDCIGCRDCFLCVGLRDKQYCFENVQLSRAEYEAKIAAINSGSFAEYQSCINKRRELELRHLFKEFQGQNTENCSGDHLNNCKEALECFDCENVEHAKFAYQIVLGAKNIYDVYQYGTNFAESYECAICGENAHHLLFTFGGHVNSSDLLYCWYMESSKNCFGCVNMHHKQYCILNKQYTKDQYENLVPEIIEYMKKTGEWGEFFPASISLYGYNKTTAQMYYPLKREEARVLGAEWDDTEPPPPDVSKVIPAAALPDDIEEIPDDLLNWAIECEVTKKPFRVIKQELAFYRSEKIPVPRRSPNQRHQDRFHRRNPRKLWDRTCGKCGKGIRTTFSPDRPEIVFCEECYLKEVY